MENSLVSVIVPVYNVENYVKKCIQSIIDQDYKNIEVILVDDGSTDSSGNICDGYSKKDNRIKTIHIKNQGVSNARNVGLDNMNGEYFIFIDSDDYIKKNMISILLKNIIDYNCDISICNVAKIDESGKIFDKSVELNKIIVLTKEEYTKKLYSTKLIHGYPINKLIKSTCLKNVRFDEKIKHLEDWDFLCRLSENITNVVYDSQDFYYFYVTRNNSAVHQKFNEAWITDLIARERNMKYVESYDAYEKDRFIFDYVITMLNTVGLLAVKNILKKNEKKEMLKKSYENYYKIKHSENLTKYEKIKLFFKIRCPIIYFRLMDKIKE